MLSAQAQPKLVDPLIPRALPRIGVNTLTVAGASQPSPGVSGLVLDMNDSGLIMGYHWRESVGQYCLYFGTVETGLAFSEDCAESFVGGALNNAGQYVFTTFSSGTFTGWVNFSGYLTDASSEVGVSADAINNVGTITATTFGGEDILMNETSVQPIASSISEVAHVLAINDRGHLLITIAKDGAYPIYLLKGDEAHFIDVPGTFYAVAMNNHDQVVVYTRVEYETGRTYLWKEEVGIAVIDELNGYSPTSINDAGWLLLSENALWVEGHGVIDLPNPEGSYGGVLALNSEGQAAGVALYTDEPDRVVLWQVDLSLPTPEAMLGELSERVIRLADGGELEPEQVATLQSLLGTASEQLGRDNVRGTINGLKAFVVALAHLQDEEHLGGGTGTEGYHLYLAATQAITLLLALENP